MGPPRSKRALMGCLVGSVLGLALSCWKIAQLGFENDQSIIFIAPFVACFIILIFSGMADEKQRTRGSNTEGPSLGSRIKESLLMTLYWRELQRLPKYWRGAEKDDLWESFKSDPIRDSIVYSVRNFGIAVVSALPAISIKASSGFGNCTTDDLSTGLVILWGLLTPAVAAMLDETRFHEIRSRIEKDYSAPSFIEKFWLVLVHLLRLCWILQFLSFSQLLYPWIAGPIWLISFFTLNVISHHGLKKCLHSYLPEDPECVSLKKTLYPDHFLFTSPTTLPCSLGSNEPIHWGQFALIIRDLIPMFCGQAVMSFLAADTSDVVVPSTFSKGDFLGLTLVGLYTAALIVYWICTQRWLRRTKRTII